MRTPYHHRGGIKHVGVDCAQFPLQVYAACGLIQYFDTGDYPPDWHLHRREERYLAHVRRLACPIEPTDIQPGDFVVFRVGRCFAHGAIVVAWPRIVHAVVGRSVMLDEASTGRLARSPLKAFTLWADSPLAVGEVDRQSRSGEGLGYGGAAIAPHPPSPIGERGF